MELPEEENTPEKRVDRIFAMMDKVKSIHNDFSLISTIGKIKPPNMILYRILCKNLKHCTFVNSKLVLDFYLNG